MNKKVIGGIVIFIAFSATFQILSTISAYQSIPTSKEFQKGFEVEQAVKHQQIAISVLESEHASTLDKLHAVQTAALAAQRAWPDDPEKWDHLYKIARDLEKEN
jgi:hypothetical protein